MLGVQIILDRLAQMPRRGQEAGMLARTVVVEPCRRRAGPDQIGRRPLVIGQVRATTERVGVETEPAEPSRDSGHVIRRAGMRRGGKRQFRLGHPERIGGAAFDQRQCLHRFDRRARIDQQFRIAAAEHRPPIGVDDDDVNAVPALNHVAASDFADDGLGHVLDFPWPIYS